MLFKAFSKALLAYCSIVGLLCFNPAQAQAQKLPLEGYVLDVGLSPIPPFVMIKGQFTDVSGIDVDMGTSIIQSLNAVSYYKVGQDDLTPL